VTEQITYTLRCREGQWSLVASLPSMEGAAEVLAKLGRNEPADVKVLVYDEAARDFLPKGSVKLGKTLQTEPAPLAQPILQARRKRSTHSVVPLAIVGVLVLGGWGARAQLGLLLFGKPAENAAADRGAMTKASAQAPAQSTIGADGTDCSKVLGANFLGGIANQVALQFGTEPGSNGEFTYWGLPEGVVSHLSENGGVSFGNIRPGGKSCKVDIAAEGQFNGSSYRTGVTCEITKYEQRPDGLFYESLERCQKRY